MMYFYNIFRFYYNMNYYNNLEIRDFLKNKINQPDVSEDKIIESLENCYRNCAFSTFPYIMHNLDSRDSISKYNSGNCIALSMYIKDYLKNKYNINSYLIPATIPNKYKVRGYLHISHVVLAIPKNNKEIFIADPAFYFLSPLKVDLNNKFSTIVFAKEIYSTEDNLHLKDYDTIDTIIGNTKIIDREKKFNNYQIIPKNTITSEVYYKSDPNDKWTYFLTEIINPDRAISDFFIGIRKDPFIMTTIIDKNGVCKGNGYFNLNSNGFVKIADKDKDRNTYHILNIPNSEVTIAKNFTKKYFKGNFNNYLKNYINLYNSNLI